MPIYEYQCKLCLHQEDKLQKLSDAPLTQCPQCHQPSFERLVSAAGFQLKGSGWYVTDFKDKPKTSEIKPTSPPSSSTEAKTAPVTTSTSTTD